MALYYNLVFGLLVIEMSFFTVLSLPFPRKIRKTVLQTASAPFRNEKVLIAIRCIFGFVLVLFVDSINRVYSVTSELHASSPAAQQGHMPHVTGVLNDRSEVQARRFYAQRNMYLCGFTLFLHMILTRTYSLVAELIVTKDKLDTLKANEDLDAKTKIITEDDTNELKALKEKLAEKDEDLEILKNQAETLSNDYNEASSAVKSRK